MNTQEKLERIIKEEIHLNQSHLVDLLLSANLVDEENIENYYPQNELDEDGNEAEPQEIFEWWAVSEWLATRLEIVGAPVLKAGFGTWWGRTETGQSLTLDSSLQAVADRG